MTSYVEYLTLMFQKMYFLVCTHAYTFMLLFKAFIGLDHLNNVCSSLSYIEVCYVRMYVYVLQDVAILCMYDATVQDVLNECTVC